MLLFMFAASVKEVHFLFATHAEAHQDNCNNHLHSEEEDHGHCNVCNFELAIADRCFEQAALVPQYIVLEDTFRVPASRIAENARSAHYLRGPPNC